MELTEAEIFDDWYKTGVSYQGKNVADESCEKYSPESIIKTEMLRRHGFSYFCADEQSVINGHEMIDAADDVIDKWYISFIMVFEFLYMLDFCVFSEVLSVVLKYKMKKCINLNKFYKHFLLILRNFGNYRLFSE